MNQFNLSKLLFLMMMITGTMITFMSSSWPATWIGLEINLLSFIPIIYHKSNILTYEAAMKYFLIQTLASSLFLISSILMTLINYSLIYFLISITMIIKLGGAPFHMWFPSVMEGLSWNNCLLLMTLQKMAPLLILSYIPNNNCINMTIMMSIIVGTIGGMNQTSTRKIMAYSSINHLGWMFMTIKMSQNLWKLYFSIYTILITSIILMMKNLSMNHINQMSLHPYSPMIKYYLMMNLLSLGGLPPFLGFLPKWITIEMAMNQSLIIMICVMVWLSLITLYYYIQLSISSFMLNSSHLKWYMFTNMPSYNFMMITTTITSLLMLPIYSIMAF
uniref:NADH-ubiquinone oxidoreductase chain 2 n=1 Tax=Truljalia hibinonis TaxID=1982313 RepID=A0A1W6QZ81_9ORTH|nr:NADH dehydrogenase subunit 2 [Truljalia hibinonis]ARO46888.1 NADH dehydrogenase subunit 2 [Truljalia hibinonis]